MLCGQRGVTLTEVLVASAITSMVAGGTLTAFVTAARIQQATNGPRTVEASGYAQQWLEALRNRVADDDTFFSSKAPGGVSLGWQDDDPATGVVRRVYRVDAKDCDGDGIVAGAGTPPEADCYAVTVKMCWNQPTCP